MWLKYSISEEIIAADGMSVEYGEQQVLDNIQEHHGKFPSSDSSFQSFLFDENSDSDGVRRLIVFDKNTVQTIRYVTL